MHTYDVIILTMQRVVWFGCEFKLRLPNYFILKIGLKMSDVAMGERGRKIEPIAIVYKTTNQTEGRDVA